MYVNVAHSGVVSECPSELQEAPLFKSLQNLQLFVPGLGGTMKYN